MLQDIDPSNMLVNWYCSDAASDGCEHRWREHRRSAAVKYVLFDFDLSLQLPPQTSLKKCRRPAEEAFTGKKMYYPYDVYQGEPYYNPFAFDVACLGNLYLCWFIVSVSPTLVTLSSNDRSAGGDARHPYPRSPHWQNDNACRR